MATPAESDEYSVLVLPPTRRNHLAMDAILDFATLPTPLWRWTGELPWSSMTGWSAEEDVVLLAGCHRGRRRNSETNINRSWMVGVVVLMEPP